MFYENQEKLLVAADFILQERIEDDFMAVIFSDMVNWLIFLGC